MREKLGRFQRFAGKEKFVKVTRKVDEMLVFFWVAVAVAILTGAIDVINVIRHTVPQDSMPGFGTIAAIAFAVVFRITGNFCNGKERVPEIDGRSDTDLY